jgi:nucleotide-binding universal stress UspA family protein
LRPIIAAVDHSSSSSAVLETALVWARHRKASVTACYVLSGGLLSQLRSDAYRSRLKIDSSEALREMCEAQKDSSRISAYEIIEGKPATQIVAAAEKHLAQLIVISSHGYSTVKQTLIGGEAERVVRRSPIPVLLIRSGTGPARAFDKVRRILVPVDFSENAGLAIKYVVELAGSFRLRVQLIHVINRQIWYDSYLVSAINVNELERHAEKEAKTRMTAMIRDIDLGGPPIETIIRYGLPFQEIVGYAKTNRTDLIVMSTRGKTSSSDTLIGSVAEKVVRHSPCATLTIRQ